MTQQILIICLRSYFRTNYILIFIRVTIDTLIVIIKTIMKTEFGAFRYFHENAKQQFITKFVIFTFFDLKLFVDHLTNNLSFQNGLIN